MPREAHETDRNPAKGFWSGTISFGLVSVPVSLFPATRRKRFTLRALGPEKAPLQRRYVGPESEDLLEGQDIVRGYETEGGGTVIVTQEELDRLAPEKSRDIDLRLFTDRETIPVIYFHRPYFLVPDGPSAKAYRPLAGTMEKTQKAGIATFVMRGREHLVAIFAENGILLAETLRFADEIRSAADIGLPQKQKAEKKRVGQFERAIDQASAEEIPVDQLHDERVDRLLILVEQKRKRNEDVVRIAGEEGPKAEVVDILEVLKRSLARNKPTSKAGSAATARGEPSPAKKRKPASSSGRKTPSRTRTAA